ncbi:hypothetical protein H6P81_005427 [Aristolochia fimbriata]|uniref:Uncharacterized protein n=1 Tax=Aristolochia fimbriata TaxID=158543 RepID=A0AAV7EYX5_ARIFI|nr:hypothetical protein H6P81_005427 [Aristolochia fimbriata]
MVNVMMASNTIFASLQCFCCSHRVTKRAASTERPGRSRGTKQASQAEGQKMNGVQNPVKISVNTGGAPAEGEILKLDEAPTSSPSFSDTRWKNGTWDLNLFVEDGKMDWDAVIVAEARRRKFLQTYPHPATHESPVLFRSSIIPWWAWLRRFHLPEAEVLNGRAAMVGFFMAYFVDALSGMGVVDQTGNSICKACLLAVVAGVLLYGQTQDFGNLRSLTQEAVLYDQQWRATYEGKDSERLLEGVPTKKN